MFTEGKLSLMLLTLLLEFLSCSLSKKGRSRFPLITFPPMPHFSMISFQKLVAAFEQLLDYGSFQF